MNVLIISAYPPESAPEANHALHISENLAKAGLTVQVICKTGSIESTHNNITIHPIMENWKWRAMPRLSRRIKEIRPDVVLLLYIGWVYDHEPMITFLPSLCKAVVPGVPCITQFENVDEYIPWRSLLAGVARKAVAFLTRKKGVHLQLGTLLHDSARIIALSSPHRDRLANRFTGVHEKTVVLPPPPLIRFSRGDAAETRKRIRREIGVCDGDFALMYWGFIYPGKGVETLLHAFRTVCNEVPGARLVLVGGCLELPMKSISCRDYYERVRKLPEMLGIADRVTWTGRFGWNSDIGSQYLHAGDACILPIDYGVTLNNSSLAAAATHGLPIIGTEIPGQTDEALEHGHNIYLCPPKDPQALAESMQQLIKNRDLRERLRTGSRNLARDWHTSERNTARLLQVLRLTIAEAECTTEDRSRTSAPISKSLARVSSGTSGTLVQSPSTAAQSQTIALATSRPSPSASAKTKSDGDAPLISVIVAAYNVSKYISQCLDSLANQTLTNIEIIVVNDGSTDNSLEIINEYANRYDNFKVLTFDSNVGTGSARNAGLSAATGQYIAFVDADDWVSIRMCEVMYRRATDIDTDVLVADAKVYYESSKSFTPLFDQYVRQNLDPQCTSTPFDIHSEPRVLLLESVLWTKLYKHSFILAHSIRFQDGMNSYEDMYFHFSVLMKAKKILLIDDALIFYRKDRSGQVTTQTSQRNFEAFDVFRKISGSLAASGATDRIWAMLVKCQLRIFDWLVLHLIDDKDKQEFFARAAEQFSEIPDEGFKNFRQDAGPEEQSKLFCMRRNWLWAYEKVARHHRLVYPFFYLLLHNRRREIVGRVYRRCLRCISAKLSSGIRSSMHTLLNAAGFERKLQSITDSLWHLNQSSEIHTEAEKPLVQVCSIDDQKLFISNWSEVSALEDSIWRIENDYYLLQTAIFREGDIVVDVGAHLGVSAIYLAKKFPFITVYALEPEPNNFDCLRRNIALNGVTNVVAINKALSGNGRTTTLFSDPLKSNWTTIDVKMASTRHRVQAVPVKTVSLPELFREHNIQHCRMLKISANGAIRESLNAITERHRIDFLCGEADLADCSKVQLEVASRCIARQHFWRTYEWRPEGTVWSWIHQLPTEIEGKRAGPYAAGRGLFGSQTTESSDERHSLRLRI